MKVEEAFAGVARIGLDTSPLIYYIEESELYKSTIETVFERIVTGEVESGCEMFLTNDKTLKRVSEIRVLTLSDFAD